MEEEFKANPDLLVLILAAGKGTRMKSNTPKVMHEIAGHPMIEYCIQSAQMLNPGKVVLVINDELKSFVEDYDYVVQDQQLGTGHACQVALGQLDTTPFKRVLILYGDTPFITPYSLQDLLNYNESADISLLGFETQTPAEYGRLIIEDDKLVAIKEHKDCHDHEKNIGLCNSGIIAAKIDVFQKTLAMLDNNNKQKEYYLTDIIKYANNHGFNCNYIIKHYAETIGINSRAALADAEKMMQDELRAYWLDNGVSFTDPATVYLSANTDFGQDCIVEPNCIFVGDVEIEDNVEIRAFSYLENCHIKQGAIVGPYARIRPGSVIGEDAKIGNFVEIKNAEIGNGSKVNHLTYIGDANIGHDSNIGAGVITCNYDGFKKHHTDIGNMVNVGANCSLVAPVKIGDNAIIGAGSVITTDVASDALALARAKQESMPGKAKEIRKRKGGK